MKLNNDFHTTLQGFDKSLIIKTADVKIKGAIDQAGTALSNLQAKFMEQANTLNFSGTKSKTADPAKSFSATANAFISKQLQPATKGLTTVGNAIFKGLKDCLPNSAKVSYNILKNLKENKDASHTLKKLPDQVSKSLETEVNLLSTNLGKLNWLDNQKITDPEYIRNPEAEKFKKLKSEQEKQKAIVEMLAKASPEFSSLSDQKKIAIANQLNGKHHLYEVKDSSIGFKKLSLPEKMILFKLIKEMSLTREEMNEFTNTNKEYGESLKEFKSPSAQMKEKIKEYFNKNDISDLEDISP